ncbi:MAG: hypothetical protein IPG53_20170 [Ignavibacteriales bacterium]|nr:hypothetical protein [Ignavibacteriales bacterium]
MTLGGKFVDEDYKYIMNMIPKNTGNDSLVVIPGAAVGPDNKVITPTNKDILIKLVKNDFKNFTRVKYLIFDMKVNTSKPNASPVKFYPLDKLKMRAFGKFSYKVDPGE